MDVLPVVVLMLVISPVALIDKGKLRVFSIDWNCSRFETLITAWNSYSVEFDEAKGKKKRKKRKTQTNHKAMITLIIWTWSDTVIAIQFCLFIEYPPSSSFSKHFAKHVFFK